MMPVTLRLCDRCCRHSAQVKSMLKWCRTLCQEIPSNSRDTVTSGRRGMATGSPPTLVEPEELKSFVIRCIGKVGGNKAHAKDLADLLCAADSRGHFSHGLNRLDMYVHDIATKICASDKEPVILKETAATAWVDGNNILGPRVGNFCMDLAIQKAKDAGVGWVVSKGSNHFGIAGWYGMRACEQGFLGMAFTNTSPLQFPTRGKKSTLGTNPLCLAAPSSDGNDFVLDMATSTAAIGKVELHKRKGIPIPNGWGADKTGKETNDPEDVLIDGGLLPLGGSETTGGYKGYGLATMVEIFCGILGGAAYGPNVRRWLNTTTEANLGHCFIAINPEMFAPGFPGRLQDLMNLCKHADLADGETEILVAGDPERRAEKQVDTQGGIRYHPNQIVHMYELAEKLGVEPMKVK